MDKPHRHSRKIHTSLLRYLAIAWLLALAAWAQSPEPAAVRNFGQINDSIYRGAAPSEKALNELQAIGVVRVIDLRESGEATGREAQMAKSLRMTYVNVPLRPWSAPTQEQVQTVLTLLLSSHDKTFVHCRRGKDRTGVAIACYRMQHDGWTNRRAFDEAIQFGMSSLQRSMRSFIVAFSPFPAPASPSLRAPLAVQP